MAHTGYSKLLLFLLFFFGAKDRLLLIVSKDMAPPWFQPAMDAILAASLAPIQITLAQVCWLDLVILYN